MTIAQTIQQRISLLPLDRQQQALEFIESLVKEQAPQGPRNDLRGILKGVIPDLPLEEFQAIRREMSSNFPREFPE